MHRLLSDLNTVENKTEKKINTILKAIKGQLEICLRSKRKINDETSIQLDLPEMSITKHNEIVKTNLREIFDFDSGHKTLEIVLITRLM